MTLNAIHILIIVPLIFPRICSITTSEINESGVNSDSEPKCAKLFLSSPQSSSLLVKNKNVTFSLGNNEQSYTTFAHVAQEFTGAYFITVTLRFNCSVLIYMKGNWLGYLLEKPNQRFKVKLGLSVESVWCICGRSDPIGDCPSHAECLQDESNDISLAGQCGRGYQQPFCGSCGFGYVVMRPGDYYPITDPQIHSVTMGKGCRLWNGDTRIDTRLPGNINIDRNKYVLCKCDSDYDSTDDDFLLDSTTPIPGIDLTTPSPNMNLETYIPVTLAVSVIVILIASISLVYKFRRKVRLIWKNSVRGVKVIPPNEIEVVSEVTAGRFGVIRLVKWKSTKCILKSAAPRTVTVTPPLDPQCGIYTKLLFQELEIVRHIGKHTNVVKLLGIVNGLGFETSIVLEYCENGDLKSYLQNRVNQAIFVNVVGFFPRQNASEPQTSATPLQLDRIRHILNSNSDTFSTFTLLKWSMEIASGMEFLGQRSVVHVDLAARNILLTVDNIVKIADFGLSKILAGPSEEFVQVGINDEENLLPLRWMGPEGRTGHFSIKSDVWSFGITLWEIYSLGQDPYENISDDRLPEMLRNGHRMSIPIYANNAIYEKLLECWRIEQSERPGFQTLKLFFESEILLMRETLEKIVNDEMNTLVSPQPAPPYVHFDEL